MNTTAHQHLTLEDVFLYISREMYEGRESAQETLSGISTRAKECEVCETLLNNIRALLHLPELSRRYKPSEPTKEFLKKLGDLVVALQR